MSNPCKYLKIRDKEEMIKEVKKNRKNKQRSVIAPMECLKGHTAMLGCTGYMGDICKDYKPEIIKIVKSIIQK